MAVTELIQTECLICYWPLVSDWLPWKRLFM